MKNRKLLMALLGIILIIAVDGCGNKESGKQVEQVKIEQAESKTQDDTEDTTDGSEVSQNSDGEISDTGEDKDKSSSIKTDTKEDNTSTNGSTTQNPTSGNTTDSNTQKPSSSSNTQKLSNSSTTPSNNSTTNAGGSNNTGNTTTKKPVKRVSEEVKSAVVPYKYGITKYDVTTNEYMTYSDGSKELLDSSSYTVYDSSNYSASDSQLKSEADSNASKYMSYYQEVLRLVNEIRAEAGVDPLTLDTTLCKAASMRALEMDYNNELSHTRPNGSACWSVLSFYSVSYGTCGENIAAGQPSASSVVIGWKNSPNHYQNMINASYTKLGVGYSAMGIGNYGHYWCQLFTN